jgi:hypothetical protein
VERRRRLHERGATEWDTRPIFDARTMSLNEAFHSGIECRDYDAAGQGELKIDPALGEKEQYMKG